VYQIETFDSRYRSKVSKLFLFTKDLSHVANLDKTLPISHQYILPAYSLRPNLSLLFHSSTPPALVIMSFANHNSFNHRVSDDETDHIYSTASTPPGAATPKPELADKRFPGIIHDYQVGNPPKIPTIPSLLWTASTSIFQDLTNEMVNSGTAKLLHPMFDSSSCHMQSTQEISSAPATRSHSMVNAMNRKRKVSDFLLVNRDPNTDSELEARPSVLVSSTAHKRTYTFSFTNILSALGLATNPSNSPSTMSLTAGAMQQNTPPQTPRASQETKNVTDMDTDMTPVSITEPSQKALPAPSIGKLTITISAGRGLRPSVDPYVICEFQSSQYISEGPVAGDNRNVLGLQTQPGASMAIQPSLLDRRKPMAIPMRSRQSSSSGKNLNPNQEISNPRWDHKAIL
jgi:hypothetical protein